MSIIGSLVVKITSDVKGLTQGLDQVTKSTHDMAKFAKVGSDIAVKAITAVGAGALAIGGNATRMAVDFETSFAGVKKTLDATDEEFQQLEMGLRGLAKEIPVNVNELNKIAESAGALGIAKEGVLDFTKVISQMATTTNLSADAAANSFARISTIMDVSAGDFSRLGSTIVDLGNKGSTTESEITEMALRIAGSAKTVGMSAAEVAGFAASLSNVGIEAEMGGTAISKVMIDMASNVASGGDKLEVFGRIAGMSADQFATAFKTNAASAIGEFIAGLGRIQQSGGNLFATLEELDIKEVRLRDTILRTASAGDMVTKTLQTARTAWQENGALSAEAGKRYETAASQMQVFQNKLNDTQITLGQALIPILLKMLEAAEPLIQTLSRWAAAFAALDPQTQQLIAGLTALAAVFYPVTIALGSLATAVKALIPLVTSLYGLILAHPFVAIGVAVAALAVLIYKHWDEIHDATKKLGESFNKSIAKGLDAVKLAFMGAKDFVIHTIMLLYDGVKTYLLDKLTAIFDKVRGGIEDVKGYFKGLYHAVVGGSYVPEMVEEIGDHMRNLDVTMTAPARNAVVNTGRVIMDGAMTWGMAIKQFASTANQSWGSISQTAASNLARMTDETVSWGEVIKGMGIQLMTNMITLVIGLATQWAIGQAMQTAASVAGDTARVASNATANATMLATNTVSATASTSIWGGAATSILGFFGMIAGGFKALALSMIVGIKAVGTFVMGVLSAIAAAFKATIFGIPIGIAILAGVVAIGVALAATGNIPFLEKGGMVTGPTMAMVGEGNASEAVIPLNDRGAKFMQSAMGTGGSGPVTIYLQVDSRTMAKAVVPKMHNIIHTKLGFT